MPWLGFFGATIAAIGLTLAAVIGGQTLPAWAVISMLGLALLALIGALHSYKRI